MHVSENAVDAYQVFVLGRAPVKQPVLKNPELGAYVQYVNGVLVGGLQSFVQWGRKKSTDALFAPACLQHGLSWEGPLVQGKTHAHSVGDWYYGRGAPGNHMLLNDDDSLATLCSCSDFCGPDLRAAAAAPLSSQLWGTAWEAFILLRFKVASLG